MADGRAFTDYRPKGVQALQDVVPLNKGSYEYREYMERNGTQLVGEARKSAYVANVCGPCKAPYDQGTVPDELSVERCNYNSCEYVQKSPDGIGLGRSFGENQETRVAFGEFYRAKQAEQRELSKAPCDYEFDPFIYFPTVYSGVGAGRLQSPDGDGSIGLVNVSGR